MVCPSLFKGWVLLVLQTHLELSIILTLENLGEIKQAETVMMPNLALGR